MKNFYTSLFLIFLLTTFTFAQDSIEGTITSIDSNQPLANKKVSLEIFDPPLGFSDPVWTDENGHYYIDHITNINEDKNSASDAQIRYIGNTILTNSTHLKSLKIFNILGEIVLAFSTNNQNIELNLKNLPDGRYIFYLEIDKEKYNNLMLLEGGNLFAAKKTTELKLKNNNLVKLHLADVSAGINIYDSTNNFHSYTRAAVTSWPGYWTGHLTFNMVLPKVVYLPDSMQFTDPEVNYPINTEVRLWQYMGRIIDENDYKSILNTLMPMKIYDPQTQPQWTQPIIEGTNNIRNQTTHNPDSLVQITNEFKPIAYSNGFSQINIVYADSNLIGQDDHGLLIFYSSLNNAFCGAELYINTSTGMQPIDIYKAIQKDILEYNTHTRQPINNPKYLATNTRGEPYNITKPEMHLIDIARTLQDIIKENNKTPIFINRFLHPGTLVKNNPFSLPDPKTEILERFNNVHGVKIKVID